LDLSRIIQELHTERKKIVELIRSMEDLQLSHSSRSARERSTGRRGRKSMDATERQQVSERMKKYWASRRSVEENQEFAATA
jgi:hypothetical protein